jgi:hypothetical protein
VGDLCFIQHDLGTLPKLLGSLTMPQEPFLYQLGMGYVYHMYFYVFQYFLPPYDQTFDSKQLVNENSVQRHFASHFGKSLPSVNLTHLRSS